MKKALFICLCTIALCTINTSAIAQDPITGIISAGIKKVIRAFDLQVQRLQTKTIWLQEAQKTLENAMQKLHLDEITGWVQKQKDLYGEYFDELWKVKTFIAYYNRIKEVTQRQVQLVSAYKQAWGLLQQDKHFTAAELDHMQAVYGGIIDESVKNLDQLLQVISSFSTQMSDIDRLTIIDRAADRIEANFNDLSRFNNQNALLSLQRAQDEDDAAFVKKMYGLQ